MLNGPRPPKKAILVIDDRKDDRRLVKLLLRKFDCEVVEAENGIDGLDLVEKHRPRLILIDLMMPGLTGLESIRGFRKKCEMKANLRLKAVPVILLSSRRLDPDFHHYLRLEGIEFHAKPVRSKDLLLQIETLVGPLPVNAPPKNGAANVKPTASWGAKK